MCASPCRTASRRVKRPARRVLALAACALTAAVVLPARAHLAAGSGQAAPVSPLSSTPEAVAFDMTWIGIPAGSFDMGCVPGDADCRPNEQPLHPITITRPFELMDTEITVGQFRAYSEAIGTYLPRQPRWNSSDAHPVVNVTWEEVAAFCEWVGGRLPTEAEWEYAARGGRAGRIYPWGDTLTPGMANASPDDEADRWTHTAPVRSFPPNDFGLYDVIGNVFEWVSDWYYGSYYARSPVEDPTGTPEGEYRVMRGGSWDNRTRSLRLSFRFRLPPTGRYNLYIGGRCARDVTGGV